MLTELELSLKTEQLFNNLEKNTGIKKKVLISNVLNGTDELEDLVDLNDCLESQKKNPHSKSYSHEEVGRILGLKQE